MLDLILPKINNSSFFFKGWTSPSSRNSLSRRGWDYRLSFDRTSGAHQESLPASCPWYLKSIATPYTWHYDETDFCTKRAFDRRSFHLYTTSQELIPQLRWQLRCREGFH